MALKSGECRGFGDCAPLPAAGTEQPEEVAAVLGAVIDAIRGRTAGRCSDLIQTLTGTPALRCGLETGLLDLIGRCTNQPVYRLLGAAAPPVVHVNALIGMLDAGAVQRATRAQAQGYRVLKIKMGALPPDLEIRRLRNLSARLPAGISLRLDANRAWNLPTIRYMFEALRNLPVESIEEPLHFPSPGRISRLQRTSPWPVALDESLARGGAGEYLSRPTVARVVLKPMVLGGPVAAMALARRARQQGMRAVVTTTLDSAVGRFAALHLAAAVDSGLAHGLATGGWLRTDLATGPSTRFGRMPLSSVPGLGIEMRDPGGWDRPAFFAGTPTREIQ